MTEKKSGEFGWIDEIRNQFAGLVPSDTEGIGDDCAVIPVGEAGSLVVTTDMLVENVHFIRDLITPENLGYKSLAVNLSDVAAMGAKPVASFLSIGLPETITPDWRTRFLTGYKELSERYSVPLLGGDTTASETVTISVTAIGKADNIHLKRRSGAKPGDLICVTGNLGDSAAGLKLLLEHQEYDSPELNLIFRHQRPEPQVREGIWLGEQTAVHAMLDISDGIASDLVHILDESGVSARIDLGKIPVSAELRQIALRYQWDAERLAVAGGEDYVLLITVEPNAYDEMNKNFSSIFGIGLKPIGEIIPGKPEIKWFRNGVPIEINWKGFSHF